MCIRPRPAGHRIQRLPRHEQDGAAGCRLHRSGGVRRDSGAGDGRTPARRVNTYFHGRLSGEVFVTLIVIMDPLGTIPLFLGLTSGRSARVRRRLAGQAVVVAGLVISTFAVFGQQILTYLGIGVPALQGAGGLLLALVALELLTDRRDAPNEVPDVNVALVPLGTPLLADPCARRTNTMVATMAPGPASSGVPKGTSATLTSGTSFGASRRSVSSSRATSANSSPPAPCSAGTPIPRYVRICWPKTANVEITRPATTTACPARRRRTRALRPLVKPRNSGIVPNGSMMTISVTKTSPDSRPWK